MSTTSTYKEAMRDAHAQATAASAQYNAAKSATERRAAVKAIRAAEQALCQRLRDMGG